MGASYATPTNVLGKSKWAGKKNILHNGEKWVKFRVNILGRYHDAKMYP
jgi:dTDP-4-dehydrorhamnose reductase